MPLNNRKEEVFERLGEGMSRPTAAYLMLLGPQLGEAKIRLMSNLKSVSTWLRDQPEQWRELIRSDNWRHTLVGCAAVLRVRDLRFLDDLVYRFRQGSWVAPQLAVTLGILHSAEAVPEFQRMIREPDSSTDFHLKAIFSAYAVLKIMAREGVREFEASDLFRRSQTERPGSSGPAYDWLVTVAVVQRQWDFWTRRDFDKLPTRQN